MSIGWNNTVFEQMLLVVGFFKLMLIAVFFASFPLVAAQPALAEDSCTGRNLMSVYKSEDPKLFAKINAESAEELNGDSIFWKVEKDGYETSYLFGTMHMADPKIATLSDDIVAAMAQSKSVVIEAVEVLDPQQAQAAMMQLQHLTMLKSGTLRDLVDDELEDALEAAVSARGLPMMIADRMEPWLVATMVALPACELARKQSGAKVLDVVIGKKAVADGKKLVALETMKEQLETMASLPQDFHVSMLEETLAVGSLSLDIIETMKHLYMDGNIGAIFPLMRATLPQSSTGAGAVQFQNALIKKRNYMMAERLLPVLKSGAGFAAVGALHLPGKSGLVNLLREEGFKVTSLR